MDREITPEQNKHNLSLENRRTLEMDGVIDVLGFDGEAVDLKTTMGILAVEGDGLRIVSMSKETGKILIEGNVDSIFYYKSNEKKQSGFSRKKGK